MIRAAITDNAGVVVDVIILDSLEQKHGAVLCPEHVGVGMLITAPVELPPLTELKAAKRASITVSRDKATTLNVTAHSRQWQADERSQKLLGNAILLASQGAPLPPVWRDLANSDMPITTLAQLVAIAGAMAVQTQAAYSKSWALKADVAAATTAEAVALVVW